MRKVTWTWEKRPGESVFYGFLIYEDGESIVLDMEKSCEEYRRRCENKIDRCNGRANRCVAERIED